MLLFLATIIAVAIANSPWSSSYEDFLHYGSEAAVKEAGKMAVEGKDYVVQDGDIMHFRFNV